jgi:ATP-binding cassette subfamily C (CFTR/MRP) protein 1
MVVLDDVFASVDIEVEAHIAQACITEFLLKRKCTVILVTHDLQHARIADHVVQLTQNGTIAKQGQPSEFNDLFATHTQHPHDTNKGAVAQRVIGATTTLNEYRCSTTGRVGNGNIITSEESERGSIAKRLWLRYIQAFGWANVAALLTTYATSQVFTYGSSWWLTQWVSDTYPALSHNQPWFYLIIYSAASLVATFLILLRSIILSLAVVRAAKKIHSSAIRSVVGAPISFFDTTPIGRVINRFSSDLQKVDVQIAGQSTQLFQNFFSLLGNVAVLALSSKYVLISFLPLSAMYTYTIKYYRSSSRELQRLESVSLSPVYAAFTEALDGADTIAAMKAEERFAQANVARFDATTRSAIISIAASRWLAIRLEFISNILLGLTAMLGVCTYIVKGGGSTEAASLAGLALSYAPSMADTINNMVRAFTSIETTMVAVERIAEYTAINGEELHAVNNIPHAPPNWPTNGNIVFSGVRMGYRKGLPDVLSDIHLSIRSREKVGVVGRTGAGKSSILVALFRMGDMRAGSISIDGVDIATISLSQLRSRLTIIPQDPVLFKGTIRQNLDPFGTVSDTELWVALDACAMSAKIKENAHGLLTPVSERGENLSTGQRQLLCIARAILKCPRVLVLDEATAHVDNETDELIQLALMRTMVDATVVTIAHRLDTILNSDRVVVIHEGRVIESGPPLVLRDTPGSMLHSKKN